eukprot:TRINITY_DN17873_c0_g1_i1.p1 TRINITY_DN17873_c0_g1~~TRINITY_DN17873_c0_g1_i1.p1  ORF type:complete len:670 (+),score=231.21 TRINITY_DN17873_c0_g1_i1:179-2188(+)
MSNIKVVLRARPLTQAERSPAWALSSNNVVSLRQQATRFAYDKVYGASSTTEQVYESVREIVTRAVEGYNGTIFAYGQTSSGKTYTMLGDDRGTTGVIPMALQQLWEHIEDDVAVYKVLLTTVEVYNENILQLGVSQPPVKTARGDKTGPPELRIMVDGDGVAQLQNAVPVEVKDAKHAWALVREACERRHVAATEMNAYSSRSHTLIKLQVTRLSTQGTTSAQLNFVDLAGSESMKLAKTHGSTQREGKNINTSLMTLVRVITALARKESHAPFRDSKLTRLLEPSLGGNAHTTVIACVTLAEQQYDQTAMTLRFAQDASRVENHPIKQCMSGQLFTGLGEHEERLAHEREIHKKEISVLQARTERLRASCQTLSSENEELQKERLALTGANRTLREENSDLVQRHCDVSEKCDSLQRTCAGVIEERDCIRASLSKAETQRDEAVREAASCDEKLKAKDVHLKRIVDLQDRRIHEHELTIQELRQKEAEMEEKIQRAGTKRVEELRNENTQLTERLVRAQVDARELKTALEDARRKMSGYDASIREHEEKMRENQRQEREASRELSKAANEQRRLEKDKAMVTDRAEKEVMRMRQTLSRLSTVECENATLKRQNAELERRLNAATGQRPLAHVPRNVSKPPNAKRERDTSTVRLSTAGSPGQGKRRRL